jgi:hypothetical protein
MKSFFLSLVLFSLVVSAQTTKEKIPMGISENKLSISVVGNPVLPVPTRLPRVKELTSS